MNIAPVDLLWFARHELRLIWRDGLHTMTGGRKAPKRGIVIGILIGTALMHLLALGLASPLIGHPVTPDKPTLVMLTGAGFLSFCLMYSQALETITRVYYQRADLDLILSSPASAPALFVIRTIVAALATVGLSALLIGPFINVLAIVAGPQWLGAYLVLIGLGAFATALAVLSTLALFAIAGAARTRLLAQILAAIVGAGFLIGIQAAAIIKFGSISQFSFFQAESIQALAPPPDAILYIPARAALGDFGSLAIFLTVVLLAFALSTALAATGFATRVGQTAGASGPVLTASAKSRPFRARPALDALVVKELRLLVRDPWLLSQTLMQILYLLPPALLLYVNYGHQGGAFAIVAAVLVMAAGQLSGGLAWLAISGEDAFDLIATAPLKPGRVLIAKAISTLAPLAIVLTPILLGLAFADLAAASMTVGFVLAASLSALMVQLWFRVRARRAQFRRRQVASRTATLAEALISILWAGAAGLAVAGQLGTLVPIGLAIGALFFVRRLRPGPVVA